MGAASLSLAAAAQVRETEEAVYPQAEYDRAALIVMHEPNEELFVGTMHPAAALFMDYFDADRAAEEHRAYQEILRQAGAEVVTVRELLLKGCVDEEGNAVEGAELEALRDFAARYLTYTCGEGVDSAGQEAYRQEMLRSSALPIWWTSSCSSRKSACARRTSTPASKHLMCCIPS